MNAGILGYFSHRRVINIDGLVSDKVLPFIKRNALFDYLKMKEIDRLADFDVMLGEWAYRVRGGCADERFDRCLRPIDTVDGFPANWRGPRLKIYEVVSDCR